MDEKYEDNMWGEIDILHQKSRRQNVSFNYFIDMLNKFQDACLDFSKNVQNILIKRHEIIEYHSTSMYNATDKFVQIYELFSKEFKDLHNTIKKQIVEPIFKPTSELFIKENELYNIYNDLHNKYNNSKLKMEKCYKNYIINMKLCENFIFNSKQMDLMIYAGENEKIKNLKNANNSIKNTKPFEEKYIVSVEKTNKDRENEIKYQNELLQFYQKLDTNFYEKVKTGIGLYLSVINKTINSLLFASQILGQNYEKISIEKDIKDFIYKNKVPKKVQELSKFIPYKPFSDPTYRKEEANKLDIYFEVIKTLRNNFKDIRLDIDMEEEEKRKRLRYLCERIFKIGSNVSFSREEKKELLEFLEKPSFKNYFILVLTRQRTKGRFKRSESLVRDLSDLLLKILELAEKEKDYESAKNCIILSQTYFYEEKNENKKMKENGKTELKKIYLFELIKNNKWLKSFEFWDGLVDLMINNEIEKNKESNRRQGIKDSENLRQDRLSNICFSQLLTFTSNMIEFGMDRKDAEVIVVKYSEQYDVTKELKETIYTNIEMKIQELNQLANKVHKNNEEKEKNENKDNNEEKEKILYNEIQNNDNFQKGKNINKEVSERVKNQINENNEENKNFENNENEDIMKNKNKEKSKKITIIERQKEEVTENINMGDKKNEKIMNDENEETPENKKEEEIIKKEIKEDNIITENKNNHNNNLVKNIEFVRESKDKENISKNKEQSVLKEEKNRNNDIINKEEINYGKNCEKIGIDIKEEKNK